MTSDPIMTIGPDGRFRLSNVVTWGVTVCVARDVPFHVVRPALEAQMGRALDHHLDQGWEFAGEGSFRATEDFLRNETRYVLEVPLREKM